MQMNLLCAGGNDYVIWIIIGVLIVMFVGITIFNGRMSKKQQKEENDRIKNLVIGDEVMLTSGIIGKVVEIKEISPVDTYLVIKTGNEPNESTLTFDARALYRVINSVNAPADTVETQPEEKTDTTENTNKTEE